MLKGYPAKYIYEPWTAPESVQRAAKCIIGKDYPVPMVNHAEVSKLNTGRMKQVYQQLALYASIGNCLTVVLSNRFKISVDFGNYLHYYMVVT